MVTRKIENFASSRPQPWQYEMAQSIYFVLRFFPLGIRHFHFARSD